MEEFDRLANRNDLEETEDHGLWVSIRDQVSLQTLYTLNEVVTLSKKIEYQYLRAGSKFSNRSSKSSNRSSKSSNSTTNKGKQSMFTPWSQLMVKENGGVNQSIVVVAGFVAQPIANANPYARPTGNKCYRCREPGHWFSTCPKQAAVNLMVAEESEVEGERKGE